MLETDLLPRLGGPGGEVEAGLTFCLSSPVTGHSEMSALRKESDTAERLN